MSAQLHFFGLALCFFIGQAGQTLQTLEPGQSIEREIAGGQEHVYRIPVQAGQFLRLLAQQKGISIGLMLTAPDGKQVIDVNFTGPGGPESLSYEALTGGDYRFIIRTIDPTSPPGSYQLRLNLSPSATEQDKQRVVAERVSSESIQLTRKGPGAAEEAIKKAEQALDIWRQLDDFSWQSYTLRLLGTANRLQGRYQKSIEFYEQAVAAALAGKDQYGEADALHNVAIPYGLMGQHEKSAEYTEKALAIWRELKTKHSQINALNNLSIAHAAMGRYEKALVWSEQSLALLREIKNRTGTANTLNTLGTIYKSLGRYDKAIEYYEQALPLMRETKNEEYEAAVLGNIGRAYTQIGRPEKSIDYQEQSLAISRRLKDRAVEARALNSLGDAYKALARFEKAIEYYEKALAIHRELKLRIDEGLVLGNLGHTYYSMGRHDKAIEYIEQALAIARETGSRGDESYFLYIAAKTERDRGNLNQARSLIERSLKLDESVRSGIYNPDSRASYFATVQRNSDFYIDLLMRLHATAPTQGYNALALEASESARARGLLELLTEVGADVREGVEATLIARERELARQLNSKADAQMRLLSRSHTTEQAAALKQEISQLENDYERVQTDIRRTSPRYAALVQPQPLNLSEIQQQLDADTLLLEYSVGEERSYLWAITRDSIRSFELPKEQQMKEAAVNLYNLVTARSRFEKGESSQQRQQRILRAEAQLTEAARGLSSMLIGPVASQLANRRLVIVADGALQYIPFAMLPSPNSTDEQPLILAHEIISVPSTSALALQRKEFAGRKPAPRMIAVIADPVFSETDQRVRLRAPAPKIGQQPTQAADVESTRIIEHLAENSATGGTNNIRIPRLPFTRREADQIISVAAGKSNLEAMDFRANLTTVTSGELRTYRYLHFATHGYLDSERPRFSALALSMVDEQGKPKDGFLRANDIYNLKLPAELVVLSACQTGLGKVIKGEGLVGLTRGFMYAGAARVVVSLWSINDKATSDLMTKFYRNMLKDGQRPAAALRAAQVEMWKQKSWHSPYYWAAFTLQGEWR